MSIDLAPTTIDKINMIDMKDIIDMIDIKETVHRKSKENSRC